MMTDDETSGHAALDKEPVIIYTDGGCQPNPGVGGWAAVMLYKGHVRELAGAEADATNNRMELTAAISALEWLKRPCRVELHTDSEYLKKGITEWLPGWKRRNWISRGSAIKNRDLWERLDRALERHEVRWKWVRGHAGEALNERCDELAGEAIRNLKQGKPYGVNMLLSPRDHG